MPSDFGDSKPMTMHWRSSYSHSYSVTVGMWSMILTLAIGMGSAFFLGMRLGSSREQTKRQSGYQPIGNVEMEDVAEE